MNKFMKGGLVMFAAATLSVSCKYAETDSENAPVSEESVATEKAIPTAIPAKDSTKKFSDNKKIIRTADIKFKVKNVAKSTSIIENMTRKFGGLVTKSELSSSVYDKEFTKISQDSTLQTSKYTMHNYITIRVPNSKMDTVVNAIAKEIDFLDSRVIKADDVSLKYLANQFTQQRNQQHQKRLEKAIDDKGKKLNNIVDAEANLSSKSETADNAKIENLSLQDQVAYSTLSLEIYQPETMMQQMIPNDTSARPNIGVQLVDSLKTGWYILESIIAFIVQLWSLILIFFVAFLIYKRNFRKLKSAI